MENNDSQSDLTNGYVFDATPKSENEILRELKHDGILSDNGLKKKTGFSYYFSINGSHSKDTVRRKPPKILEKIDNCSKNNQVQDKKLSEEKMNAAEIQHREFLKSKGESARVFEERYAKLKERREKKEAEKRRRLEKKMERAEKNRKNREKCLPTTMARVLRVQERSEVQQNKMLDKFLQKRKREERRHPISESKSTIGQFDTFNQTFNASEREMTPVELFLKNSHYPDSPQVSP